MIHWLHSLLPHIPHYGYVLVFIVVFLNNIGAPLPGTGRNDSFGGRIYLRESRGFAVGAHGGRNGGLFPGRHLCLLAGTAVGPWQLGNNSLAPSHAPKAKVARAFFQTSWHQGCFYRAVHRLVSARRGQFVGRHVENAMAKLSFLQPHGLGSLYHQLHLDRIFFWEEVETHRGTVGSHGTLPDCRRDSPHCTRPDFQACHIRIFGAPFFHKTQARIMVEFEIKRVLSWDLKATVQRVSRYWRWPSWRKGWGRSGRGRRSWLGRGSTRPPPYAG